MTSRSAAKWFSHDLLFYQVTLIRFFTILVSAFLSLFCDTLFLQTYPSEWLAYLSFIAIPLKIATVTIIGYFYVHSHTNVNVWLTLTCIAGCLSYLSALSSSWFWMPFLFIVFFQIFGSIVTTIAFNVSSMSFDIQTFKRHNLYLTICASVAWILSSLFFPLIVSWTSLTFTFSCTLAWLILLLGLLLSLENVQHHKLERIGHSEKIFNYPLAKILCFIATLSGAIYLLVGFCVKNELALNVSPEYFPLYIGWGNALSYSLILLAEIFALGPLLRYFGAKGIIISVPFIIIAGATIFASAPSLATAFIFYLLVLGAVDSAHIFAVELILNVLPTKIRLTSKIFTSELFFPLGILIASALLSFVAFYNLIDLPTLLPLLAIIVILISTIWALTTKIAKAEYLEAIKVYLPQRYFSAERLNFMLEGMSDGLITQAALNILASAKAELYPLLFSLLSRQQTIPANIINLIIEKIPSINEELQQMAIELIEEKDSNLNTAFLINLLENAHYQPLKWLIVKILYNRQAKESLPLALRWSHQDSGINKIYATFLLGRLNSSDQTAQQLQLLIIDAQQQEPAVRLAAAQIMGTLAEGAMIPELKNQLQDSDRAVATTALKTLASYDSLNPVFLPALACCLERHRGIRGLTRAFLVYEQQAIPYLLEIIAKHKTSTTHAALQILTLIPGSEAELAILQIAQTGISSTRTMLATSLITHKQSFMDNKLHDTVAREVIINSFAKRQQLLGLLEQKIPFYLRQETLLQLRLTSIQCLCWFAICVHTSRADAIISNVSGYTGNERLSDIDETLELLSIESNDRHLHALISDWNYKAIPPLNEKLTDLFTDPGSKALAFHFLNPRVIMDDQFNKVIALRTTPLFAALPSEILYIIAQETSWRETYPGDEIFIEGDRPNGLYIVASGEVQMVKQGLTINLLKEGDFFGEAGVLSSEGRLASAIGHKEGMLLFISKQNFDSLILDYPEILTAVMRQLISYLRMKQG
jgi:hypothetical protein